MSFTHSADFFGHIILSDGYHLIECQNIAIESFQYYMKYWRL